MCKITSGELCPDFGLPSTRNMPANWSESIAVISISRKVKQVKYLEKLKELGLFGIKKKRPSEDFIVTFNYLNGRSSEDGAQLFLEVHRERMSLKCTPAAGKEVLVRYMEKYLHYGVVKYQDTEAEWQRNCHPWRYQKARWTKATSKLDKTGPTLSMGFEQRPSKVLLFQTHS